MPRRTPTPTMTDRPAARPRGLAPIALAVALAMAGVVPALRAQEPAAPAAAPAAAAPVADPAASPTAARPAAKSPLAANVEDFWHYARIARYDVANIRAKAILDAGAQPLDVLNAFEAVAGKRQGDDLSAGMVRFQATPEISESAKALQKVLIEGRYARRTDAKFITQNIERLITNQIGYENGLANLRNSGEMAVPLLLDYLRSPDKAQYHDTARRALKDLGRVALNPLVAATEMQDTDTLALVVNLLGELGYNDAAPYVQRVQSTAQSGTLKTAAADTLAKLGSSGAADAAFLALAERFYAGKSAIAPDNRNPTAFVWYWTEGTGLVRREVPPTVFAEIMAMRASEYALQLGQGMGNDTADQAMSLWLAANYKRQVELAGAADPTRAEGQPNAHYYGVTSGPKYLGKALKRTLDDADSAVAFEILRSQQEVIGNKTLDIGGEGQSLVQALGSPDRKVRFEAAFALAAARPSEAYSGSDTVVPLLGEALSQTGKATALVIAGNTDKANAVAEPLKAAGYEVVTSTTAADAGKQAMAQPAIDVVVFDGTMNAGELDGVLTQLTTSPKLKGSARLALVQTTQSPFEERKAQDPLLSTATATGGDEIKAAVDAARTKGGALAIDPAIATDYSLRAAAMLKQIGTTGGVYDLKVVKPTLLKSLSDPRPEIVTATAQVMTQFDDADGQQALLARAAAAETPELRIALYKALAANAKQFGNKLGDAVAGLEKTVTDEADLNVRNAAAEARGALNLPSEQAKTIIVKQIQR